MSLVEEVRIAITLPDPHRAREIRVRAGVSGERLAQELGVSRGTVAKWEAGTRFPRASMRAKYARLLADLEDVVEAA